MHASTKAGPESAELAAELPLDHVGDTELAHRGEAVGGARVGHFAEIVGRARPEDIVGKLCLTHRGHQLAQDHGFESFGRLAQPAVAAARSGGVGVAETEEIGVVI